MTLSEGLSRRAFMGRTLGAGAALAALGAVEDANAKTKSGWQIGCYTRPWAKYEYTVALDAIAEAGFKYAGLMTTTWKDSKNGLMITVETSPDRAHEIGEALKQRGLKAPSAYGGNIPVKESLKAAIAGMHTLIDNCEIAGVANLLMGGVGDEKLAEVYYKAIAESAAYAKHKKVGLSVKPHGGTNSTGPQCRKLIESVNKKNFGLWYDPGNIFYYSDGAIDPVNDAATVNGLVVGMAVKDYRQSKIVDITPGTGQVNFAKVMELLKAGGFTSGPLVIECLTPGELPQLLEEAKKARAFVEQLVGQKA